MLQFQETDNIQDIPVNNNGVFFPQSGLNGVCSDWNINDPEGLCMQGNIPSDKEFNFNPFQCNCNSLPSGFTDTSWNMGYQFGGNQFTSSACCMLDQHSKKVSDCALPPLLSEIEPFQAKDIENKHVDYGIIPSKQLSSTTTGDFRLLSCSQTQQPVTLPLYNPPFPTQDANVLQFSTNNINGYNYCLENDCIDKFSSPSKNQYTSCVLEQNLDLSSIRTENIGRSNDCRIDLSSFIPMSSGDDTILNVNESDEDSEIIVEDSDTESEVSIDVGPYMNDKEMEKEAVMRCFVCNLSYSEKLDFVQVNSSFPLTFISQTPVMLKLIEIIPIDMQTSVRFENNLICKRCLNLIDTIENLEVRLLSVKKAVCDFVSRSSKEMPDEEWNLLEENSEICVEDPVVRNMEPLPAKETVDIEITDPRKTVSEKQIDVSKSDNNLDDHNNKTPTKSSAEILDSADDNNKIESGLNSQQNPSMAENSGQSCYVKNKVIDVNENLIQGENVDSSKDITSKNEPQIGEGKYQCDRCGKMYRFEKKLVYHIKKHLGDFSVKCSECGKGFMRKNNLEIHLRKHREHICINCRASFVSDLELAEHLKNCLENKFSCTECKLLFTSENKLLCHREKHKVSLNICSMCNKFFKHPSYLIAHMKSHSDDKPFSCEKCGRTYKNRNHLRRHLKSHDTSLKCLKCQKVFSSPIELKKHLSVHTEEVKCELCNKTMSKKYFLEHQKIHQNTKKRKECPICKKLLTTNIKVHMSKHALHKEYKCEICSTDFTFKHSLTKHMRLKHKDG